MRGVTSCLRVVKYPLLRFIGTSPADENSPDAFAGGRTGPVWGDSLAVRLLDNSQFPDIRVCDGRTGVCSIGAVAVGVGLSELTEEYGKADLQFGCSEYHAIVLIVVFPVSAGWSSG
jgi:hypothetical protein